MEKLRNVSTSYDQQNDVADASNSFVSLQSIKTLMEEILKKIKLLQTLSYIKQKLR